MYNLLNILKNNIVKYSGTYVLLEDNKLTENNSFCEICELVFRYYRYAFRHWLVRI